MPKITPDRNESLRQLRRVVEAAPVQLFHMDAFTHKTSCGTAHCAAGWAAIDPWFKERGLRVTRYGDIQYLDFRPSRYCYPFRPLELFFTLNKLDTSRLFGGGLHRGEYVPKEKILKNIDCMLSGEKPLRYRPQIWPESVAS